MTDHLTGDVATEILTELRAIRKALETQHRADDLLTAAQVAQQFGVVRDWVYGNADRLGAIRLPSPTGERPRLRFHPATVRDALADDPQPPSTTTRRSVDLLPIRERRTQQTKEPQ